jgi:hypothetical protein
VKAAATALPPLSRCAEDYCAAGEGVVGTATHQHRTFRVDGRAPPTLRFSVRMDGTV